MKLFKIILLSSVGCSNAQIVRPFFNSFISPLLTGGFSDLLQSALSSVEPLAIGLTSSIDVGNPPGCSGETKVSFTVGNLYNISTLSLSTLEMSSFCFSLPSFGVGMLIESGIPSLLVTLEGNVTSSDPDCGSLGFTGSGGITDVAFNFGFDAAMQFAITSFSFDSLNISAFEFSWNAISIELSNLGDDFESIAEDIENLLNEEVKGVVLGVVNATLLQDAVDTIVPFSIP